MVERDGFAFSVDIESEKLPLFCTTFVAIGHSLSHCRRTKKANENKDFLGNKKVVTRYIPKKPDAKNQEIINLDPQLKGMQDKGKGVAVDHTLLNKEVLLQGETSKQQEIHPVQRSISNSLDLFDAIKSPDMVINGELMGREILQPANSPHHYDAKARDSDNDSLDTIFDESADPVHMSKDDEIVQETPENLIQQGKAANSDPRQNAGNNNLQIANDSADCPKVVQKNLSILKWGDRAEEELGDYSISPEFVNHGKNDDEGYEVILTKSQGKKKA